jgi:hypothetical protein
VISGRAGRGRDDVGIAYVRGEVRVRVWQRVMVACFDAGQHQPSGRPTVIPRPTMTTSAPAIGTS